MDLSAVRGNSALVERECVRPRKRSRKSTDTKILEVADPFRVRYISSPTEVQKFRTQKVVKKGSPRAIHLCGWRHACVVLDRSLTASFKACRTYIDGMLAGAVVSTTATVSGNFGSAYKLFFGARNSASLFYSGNIKGLRISTPTNGWSDEDIIPIYVYDKLPSDFTLLNNWTGEDGLDPTTDSEGGSNIDLTNVLYSSSTPF